MAKVQRHVELEESHITAIQNAFGGSVKLSYILNELLFQFHNILQEKEISLSSMIRETSERTHEHINDSL